MDLVTCLCCDEKVCFEEGEAEYGEKVIMGEGGQQISREAAENKAKYRLRCSKFRHLDGCLECKVVPYHDGYTCESLKVYEKANKCRFCKALLDEGAKCRKGECKKLRKTACTKKKDCGHPCGGYKKET